MSDSRSADNATCCGSHVAESRRLFADIRTGRVRLPNLLVWPETATTVRDGDRELDALVRQMVAPALIGALDVTSGGRAHNSVIAWHPATGRGARYEQQLVPFGEYPPAPTLARLVTPLTDNTDLILPGSGHPAALPVGNTTVGTFI